MAWLMLLFCCIQACTAMKPDGCPSFDSKNMRKQRTINRGDATQTPKNGWSKKYKKNKEKKPKEKRKKDKNAPSENIVLVLNSNYLNKPQAF